MRTLHKHRTFIKSTTGPRLTFESLEARAMLSVTTAVQNGSWDDPNTWDSGVPSATLRALLPPGITVTLDGSAHVAQEIVVQGVLNVEESPGVDKALTTDWIHVNSGGRFQIGNPLDRYDANDFVLTLTGTDPTETFNIEGVGTVSDNNGFLMAASGGRLEFFGEEKLTFTKLAQTAEINDSQILVESAIERNFDGVIDAADGALNWEVGDEIVIASSSRDYRDEEVRSITAIADQGDGTVLLSLDAPLNNRHYGEIETYSAPNELPGDYNHNNIVDAADFTVWRDNFGAADESSISWNGDGANGVDFNDYILWSNNFGATTEGREWDIDMRAEVAILNRNVRIQGLAAHDTDNVFGDRARFNAGTGDGFGGHTMIMPSAGQITIDSVQFDRMGQTARLGRYPIHWHLAGDRTGDILRNSSITNSNNRGVTVHGTQNLLIEGNVLHDIHGHGFFMEDGVETGNEFLANIAFGIHKVGRSAAVGDFAPDLNDPFIVDTHDHVGQNANRFLSSAAYWITNPDNTWIGNVSAGSEGTGFWFILPNQAIGTSGDDPQYANVDPRRTDLRQFDHNSSHASPAGLNFDRGRDIEVPVGGTLQAFFDGITWLPPNEPQINYYTAYSHRVGVYHRGFDANFHQNRYADNFTSTFITFTQRITDTLYVGNSRGNADLSQPVTGHTIYDGANTLDGNHFAGFSASNAHTYRVHSAARRHTSHVVSNQTFENDGSANNISIATQGGGANHNQAVGGAAASAIYDMDGSLTGHVGGVAGSTVVTNHPFFYDDDDFQPAGWNAWVSDDIYAMVSFEPNNVNADFRVTSPDGDAGTEDGNNFNTHVKTDDGDYVIDFPEGVGSVADGFELTHYIRVGPNSGSTVMQFVGVGNLLAPTGVPQVADLAALRNSNVTAYAIVGGDLWYKAFSASNGIEFESVGVAPQTLWTDNNPLSGTSSVGDSLTISTVDSGAATGNSSFGNIGAVTLNGLSRFENLTGGEYSIDPIYRGLEYRFEVDYFIPSTTTFDSLPGGGSPDVFYLQMNFNGNNTASAGFLGEEDAGLGWNTLTLSGTIPSTANTAEPFFIVADGGFGSANPNGSGTGVAVYIDNITFTIGFLPAIPAPEIDSLADQAGDPNPRKVTPKVSAVSDAWTGRDFSTPQLAIPRSNAHSLVDRAIRDMTAKRERVAGWSTFLPDRRLFQSE